MLAVYNFALYEVMGNRKKLFVNVPLPDDYNQSESNGRRNRPHRAVLSGTAPLPGSTLKNKMKLKINRPVACPPWWLGLTFVLIFMIRRGICQPAVGSALDSIMQLGKWRIEYNLAAGSADIFYNGELVIPHACAVVHLPEVVSSADYKSHKLSHRAIHDRFGSGIEYVVESSHGREDTMIQTFWLYEHSDCFLADVEIGSKSGVAANYMSPITSQTPSHFLPAGDDR